MNLRLLLAPAALIASAQPILAAPFCHLGTHGFEFSNRMVSWKLELQESGGCIMGWTRGERNLLLRTVDRNGRPGLEVILDLPEGQAPPQTLALEDGDADADRTLAAFAQLFALEPKDTAPDGFHALMAPFLQAMNVEAEAGTTEGEAARHKALHDYCTAQTGHGVGSVRSVKRLMDAFREALMGREGATAREHLKAFRAVPAQETLFEAHLRVYPLLNPAFVTYGLPRAVAAAPAPASAVAVPDRREVPAATRLKPMRATGRARSVSPPHASRENPAATALVKPAPRGGAVKPEASAPARMFGTQLPLQSRDTD